MLRRYGDKALEESTTRIDELTVAGDHDGADIWRRITTAVVQLAYSTPPDHRTDRTGPETVRSPSGPTAIA
jgi:hypothetical protein